MDDEDHESENFKTRSLLIDKKDAESKRMDLVDQIDAKLEHYGEYVQPSFDALLLMFHQMNCFSARSARP